MTHSVQVLFKHLVPNKDDACSLKLQRGHGTTHPDWFLFLLAVINNRQSVAFHTQTYTMPPVKGKCWCGLENCCSLLSPLLVKQCRSSLNNYAELLFVGCLMSQLHASVSQRWICLDNCMRCHTEKEVANHTFISPSHSILIMGLPVPALAP